MFAVRYENQPSMIFWQSPDPDVIMSSTPERWDLHEAKLFVDQHQTEDQPLAVYHIRGWYHKRIYP